MSTRRQSASGKITGSTSHSTVGRSRSCISSTIRRVSVGNRWSRSRTTILDQTRSSEGRHDELPKDLPETPHRSGPADQANFCALAAGEIDPARAHLDASHLVGTKAVSGLPGGNL